MILRAWFLSIFLLGLACSFAGAEDASPVEKKEAAQPAPAAVEGEKKDPPGSIACEWFGPIFVAEEERKDPPAAAEGEKKDPTAANDPKKIEGTPPVFPIKSERYGQIDDSYENIVNNMYENQMDIEYGAMEDMLVALRASSQEHIQKNLDEKLTYKNLMSDPQKYRGSVVRINGILEEFKETRVTPNMSGLGTVFKGQTSNTFGQVVSFRCVEPLPDGLKVGQPVQLVGIFLQRYAYLNRLPGEKLTWTPLLFVRRVEPYTDIKQATSGPNPMSNGTAIIIFLFIGAAAAVWCYSRMKVRAVGGNHFSRIKAEKQGPAGNFPRPGKPHK